MDCVDLDECKGGLIAIDCGDNAVCSTPDFDSYLCSCKVGFSGDAITDGQATCAGDSYCLCYLGYAFVWYGGGGAIYTETGLEVVMVSMFKLMCMF